MRTLAAISMLLFNTLLQAQTLTAVMQRETLSKSSSAVAGAPATPSSGTNSNNNRDFFSALLAAFETFSKSGGEALTFERNFSANLLHANARGKVQAILRKPDLSAPLIAKLGDNTKRIEELRGNLSYGDDVAFALSISPDANAPQVQFATAFQNLAAVNQGVGMTALATSFANAAGMFPMELANESGERISEMIVEPFAERMALAAANESKWVFEAAGRLRHETVGPNEISVRASWEIGPGAKEIAKLRTGNCAGMFLMNATLDATTSSRCAGALASAVVTDTNDRLTFKQARIAFSLEGKWFDADRVQLSDPSVDLPGSSSHSIAIAVNGGFDVFTGTPSESDDISKRGRLDFALTYDDVTGDPARDNKFIASMTYTQRVADNVQFPVSLVYASKSDYLTNVDRKLNAHFGISYKVPRKK